MRISIFLFFLTFNCLVNAQVFPVTFSKSEFNSGTIFQPISAYDSILILNNDFKKNKFIILTYINGDCSLCLIGMKEIGKKIIEEFTDEIKENIIYHLFVVNTADTMYFNFHREELKIKSPIFWDRNEYLKKVVSKLQYNESMVFNTEGTLLARGDILRGDIILKIIRNTNLTSPK